MESSVLLYKEKMTFMESNQIHPRFKMLQLYFRECLKLKYEEEPNYDALQKILEKLIPNGRHDVAVAAEERPLRFWECENQAKV